MGLFDLPSPLFAWLDTAVSGMLPATARLMLWGAIGGLVSMGLYRLLSPQRRIAQGKRELAEARRRLDAYDGEMNGAWPLIGTLLKTAVRQVGRVGAPALLASLPLLSLLLWLSTAYGHDYPEPGSSPQVQVSPSWLQVEWVGSAEALNGNGSASRGVPHVVVAEAGGGVVADVPLAVPVPILHKRRWWNALLGNPAGYLPSDAAVERVRIDLPQKEYLPFGPQWVRGWEMSFFTALVAVSLGLKLIARIE